MSKDRGWIVDNISEDVAKSLFKVRVKLEDERIVERDYTTDIEIDYNNLEDQLRDAPSIYAFWSTVLAEQKALVAITEMQIKRRRGKIVEDLTKSANTNDELKTTKNTLRASDIKELIEADKNLLELQVRYITAEKTLSKLYAIVRSLEMKNDNLRSLAGFRKQELRNS